MIVFVYKATPTDASADCNHKLHNSLVAMSGFCGRFHLARVFKEVTSYSPAQYWKQYFNFIWVPAFIDGWAPV